jgi:peptide/nickel transport system substrate-binding protein
MTATTTRLAILVLAACLAPLLAGGRPLRAQVEPPVLAEAVRAGRLPPVAARLPAPPLVVDLKRLGKTVGRHGGSLKLLMGREQDTRMLVVYGYARLVGYDPQWNLEPDILERFEVEEGRKFTFHLRKGHKWSDGQPFTSEDFRYYWEDVLGNVEMSPGGLPRHLAVEGRPPLFEVLDETTVRYTWDRPNPDFLPLLAGARPEDLFQPAHYLRNFHARYADAASLDRQVADAGQRNWVALHFHRAHQYKNDNPDLPTLQPWRLITRPPSNRFDFERNPYFHRVDPEGRQLPYIDEVNFSVVSAKLIPAKTAAGESDLQARGLGFENLAVLKQGAKRKGYNVFLWRTASGAEMALYPNLNVSDPEWRKVVREPAFRRALSLAIDRDEVNRTIYFGLASPGGNTVLPEGALFKPEYAQQWTQFNLAEANRLLDGIGLAGRDGRGVRLLADGRPVDIIVETAGEDPTETDVLQLVRDSWAKIGIQVHIKPLQREVLRNRIIAGATLMSIWKGLENGLPTPEMSPHELAPTSQLQLNWPKWGQHFETSGQAGEPVDEAAAKRLVQLYQDWREQPDAGARTAIWQEMLAIHADQVFSIGIVRGVPQPVVVNQRLRNVPENGVYNWEPGAHFGIHHPDTFWFAERAGN